MFKTNSKNVYILIIMIFLGFLFYYNQNFEESKSLNSATNLNLLDNGAYQDSSVEKPEEEIIIHLSGAVNNAGVYKLTEKNRMVDLIKAAGGLKENADLKQINLAEKLFDGQKLIIPTLNDETNNLEAKNDVFSVDKEQIISNTYTSTNNDNLININQADQSRLEKLSGIGPSKAKSIIKYREENSYINKKEDLLNISGIGTKTLEKIIDEIVLR